MDVKVFRIAAYESFAPEAENLFLVIGEGKLLLACQSVFLIEPNGCYSLVEHQLLFHDHLSDKMQVFKSTRNHRQRRADIKAPARLAQNHYAPICQLWPESSAGAMNCFLS